MRHNTIRFCLALAALGLDGCAHMAEPKVAAQPPRSIDGPLQRSADQIARAWTMLGDEKAAVHPPAYPAPPILPPSLSQRVILPWDGPVEPIVEKLALIAGYQLEIIGKRPPSPIIVTLRGQHSIFDALRIIGEETGKSVDIRLNAITKTVELHYVDAA